MSKSILPLHLRCYAEDCQDPHESENLHRAANEIERLESRVAELEGQLVEAGAIAKSMMEEARQALNQLRAPL